MDAVPTSRPPVGAATSALPAARSGAYRSPLMPAPTPRRIAQKLAALTGTLALAAACSGAPEPVPECPKQEPIAGKVVCPPGTDIEDDKCVQTDVRIVVKCPEGSHFEDDACRAVIDTSCPSGMTFQPGTGCVPVIAQIDPPPSAPVGLTPSGGKSKCPTGMVLVAGGTFTLGGHQTSSGTSTTVKDFCLDLTEVTVGAYKVCSKAGTCPTSQLKCNPDSSSWPAGDDKLPLNCIDYNDSATYCVSVGKRLATEDEWEWAARGGGLARKYPWGTNEDWTKVCASTPNKRKLPCKVGSFTGGDTPLGIHDMAGSLWEWTTTTRPGDNSKSTDMAIRGGGWDIVIGFPSFASGSRVGYETTYRSKAVGFRCAKSP